MSNEQDPDTCEHCWQNGTYSVIEDELGPYLYCPICHSFKPQPKEKEDTQ